MVDLDGRIRWLVGLDGRPGKSRSAWMVDLNGWLVIGWPEKSRSVHGVGRTMRYDSLGKVGFGRAIRYKYESIFLLFDLNKR